MSTALGKKLNADFVVWGSITKIGNSLSIDGKLVDIAANKAAVAIVAQMSEHGRGHPEDQ